MNIQLQHRDRVLWGAILVLACSLLAAQTGRQAAHREDAPVWCEPDRVLCDTERDLSEGLADEVAVNPDLMDVMVEAVIMIESGGCPDLVGQAGERGLMQIMPGTWAACCEELFGEPLPFDLAFDPELNRRVGTFYLRRMQQFLAKNRVDWQADPLRLLLACYNAGPDRVQQSGFQLDALPSSTISYANRGVALFESLLHEAGQNVLANAMRDRDS